MFSVGLEKTAISLGKVMDAHVKSMGRQGGLESTVTSGVAKAALGVAKRLPGQGKAMKENWRSAAKSMGDSSSGLLKSFKKMRSLEGK